MDREEIAFAQPSSSQPLNTHTNVEISTAEPYLLGKNTNNFILLSSIVFIHIQFQRKKNPFSIKTCVDPIFIYSLLKKNKITQKKILLFLLLVIFPIFPHVFIQN